MHIAGGIYRELCEVPTWNAELGSGGRAAATVSSLSPETILHTYARNPNSPGIASLRELGVDVIAQPSSTGVAFAYFHPLSRPHIEPPVGQIPQQPAIKVSGATTLRFGFLEGDVIVTGKCAIYDPQTSNDPQPFGANGSTVSSLALVMNELELRTMAGTEDVTVGAQRAMQAQGAAVIVVKAGTSGAFVFEDGREAARVPAYSSKRVFKIGTGDVFSAVFAYEWGEAGRPASEAADLASRSVAAYCAAPRLPLPADAIDGLEAIGTSSPGSILLEGAVDTLGRRYVMEEARFCLSELGATVICPRLDGSAEGDYPDPPDAILVIAGGAIAEMSQRARRAHATGVPIVVLAEQDADRSFEDLARAKHTDDFASALYFAVWAAIPSSAAPCGPANDQPQA
jgi:hypothetical protein